MSNTETRIYVACLAAYNAGKLHGIWIDDCTDADVIGEKVAEMLRKSPEPNTMVECPKCEGDIDINCGTCNRLGKVASAEEPAIHDHEGFGKLIGEYTSFEDVAKHAEMIEKHGDAWTDYCEWLSEDCPEESDFEDAYRGKWDSEQDYAEELVDSLGLLNNVSEEVSRYFDYESYTRDLFIDMYRSENGNVFVSN